LSGRVPQALAASAAFPLPQKMKMAPGIDL
jgi:hypothetical protein